MSERKKNNRLDWLLGAVLFVLLMLRACVYGVQYWPQLDDYIQYHNYAAGFTFRELQELTGLLASRPLAGLADYFLWTPLFDRMILGVAVISGLYCLCVVWMKRLMERYVSVGPVFFVVMGLLPLGVEGTYWMSASTRIVCGLLFACLAAKVFGHWLDRGGWSAAVLFMLLIPVPFGFYEQSAVLAMTLIFGMAILGWSKAWKRSLLSLWAFPAAGLYFWVTGRFAAETVYSSRAELVLPGSDYYWDTFWPDILGQIKTVFLDANASILAKGFLRSVRQIRNGELLLWTVAVVAVCVLFGLLAEKADSKRKGRRTLLAVLIGVLLAVAPITPFLVLANPWFSLRGAVISFGGLALVCDALVMALCQMLPGKKKGTAIVTSVAALVFCLAGASEIGDYRDTWQDDQHAAQAVIERLEQDYSGNEAHKSLRIGVLGMEKSNLPDQNFNWHEHIHGCTESDWALAGVMTYLSPDPNRPSVTPLPTDPIYRRWNAETSRPQLFDALYWYDGEALTEVSLKACGEREYEVWTQSGLLGYIWEEDDSCGYFRLA